MGLTETEDLLLAIWKPYRHPRWPKGSSKGGQFMELLDVLHAAEHSISGRVNLDYLRTGANRIKTVRAVKDKQGAGGFKVSAKLHNGKTRSFLMDPDGNSMADFMKVLELIDRAANDYEIKKFIHASRGKTNKEIHGTDPLQGTDDPKSAMAHKPAVEGLKVVDGTDLMVWDDFGATLKHVSSAGGTTGAQWYEDEQGDRWLVKQDEDDLRTQDEFFANAVFAKMGIPVPQAVLTKVDGKPAYAAKQIPGNVNTISGKQVLAGDYAMQLRQGVIADMLLGHRDAFGFGPEAPGQNIVQGHDGRLYRIDFGGTFDWKGLAGKKDFQQDYVAEFDGFMDPQRQYYKAIQAGVWPGKDDDLRAQADKLAVTLSDSWLDQTAAKIYSKEANGRHRASALKGRRSYLFERTRPNEIDIRPLNDGLLVPTGGPTSPGPGRWAPGQVRGRLSGKQPKAVLGYSQQAYDYINPFLRKGELRYGTSYSQQKFNVQLIDGAMNKSWLPNMVRYRSVSRSVLNDLGIDGTEFKAAAQMLSSVSGQHSAQSLAHVTELADRLKGGEFTDDAYMSTAEQIHTTQTFGVISNAAIEIKIKAGTYGLVMRQERLSAYSQEREILLHRGTRLRITGNRLAHAGGKTYIVIEAEVVDQKQKAV